MIFSCRAALFLALVFSLVHGQPATAQSLPLGVMEALRQAAVPEETVGLYVQEVGSEQALLSVNHALPMNPASTMKLVTTSIALDMLGPAFTWKTEAYATGVQEGDILKGDLIIKGSGDPKLVLENFWLFLRQIRSRGIREIHGNLVLDRSLFADSAQDAAEFDGEPFKPYNAIPDALLLNYKTFSFRFMPDPVLGLVSIAVNPPVAGYPVIAPRLGDGECGDWRQKVQMRQEATVVDFAGSYPLSCGEKILHVHAWQMTQARYLEVIFRRIWSELGGTLHGNVQDGIVPSDAWLLAQHESASLAEVVRDINKFSNNVMARQVLLTLAARFSGVPATVQQGGEVISTWLSVRQIPMPELAIENGSGLSRQERISAGSLGRLLVAAFRAPTMPEFIASLPLVGHDGTMRSRLQGRPVAGHAHIKTGLLKDVRAIAGYVLSASGKRYAVVCIINHPNAIRAHAAQDLLVQWVHENG